ncbi:hypothetical protein [Tahibacter caeni]|uniref:hypothetical protein n=1 Tax=Tahibacter caeni TaxID=1453545 RepID=UPI002148D91A|nr:hypothetical protein [Tahibacter caeni]
MVAGAARRRVSTVISEESGVNTTTNLRAASTAIAAASCPVFFDAGNSAVP